MKRLILIAIAAATLSACAATPVGQPPLTDTEKLEQAIDVACFTAKSSHIAFQIFAAAKPGVLSAQDMAIEGAAIAGITVLCTPPYAVSDYKDVINKILSAAGQVADQLSKANSAVPSP